MIQVRSILSIASVTFREIVRDKIFYNILALGFFLYAAAYLASQLTFIRPERVVLSFGLTSFLITGLVMSVLIGASLIPKEYEKRTIYLALSKPLSRFDFLCGKFLGLQYVLFLNWIFLSLLLLLSYTLLGGSVGVTFFIGCLFLLFQFLLASSLAVMFSTFTTVSLTVILSAMLFLIGSNVSQLAYLAQKSEFFLTQNIFLFLSKALPQFEAYQLGMKVVYDLPVEPGVFLFVCLYTFVSVILILIASGLFLSFKDS